MGQCKMILKWLVNGMVIGFTTFWDLMIKYGGFYGICHGIYMYIIHVYIYIYVVYKIYIIYTYINIIFPLNIHHYIPIEYI